MLKLKSVYKSYGNAVILKDVSVQLDRFDVVALLGPSGCGKSTLLRCIAGLESADSGEICFNGRVFQAGDNCIPSGRRKAIMLFQDFALFPNMTAAEQLRFAGADASRCRELLALVQMEDRQNHYPHQLSGGQQQRLALARALAAEPALLLLDEPFSAVDEHQKQNMRVELLQLLRQSNIPTIMVTHNRQDAAALADVWVVMDQGQMVQHGAPEQVYKHPVSLTSASLTGDINVLPGADRSSCTGIRPEHVKEGAQGIHGTVLKVFPEGAGYTHIIAVSGTEWKIFRTEKLNLGASVYLEWDEQYLLQL